jgi:hypothetical protein
MPKENQSNKATPFFNGVNTVVLSADTSSKVNALDVDVLILSTAFFDCMKYPRGGLALIVIQRLAKLLKISSDGLNKYTAKLQSEL